MFRVLCLSVTLVSGYLYLVSSTSLESAQPTLSTTINRGPRRFSTIWRRSSKWRLFVAHGYTINSRISSIIWRARNCLTIHFATKYKLYERPENCDTLTPVKVNPPIWEKLKSETRSSDLRFQKIRTALNKSLIAMVQVTDCLTKSITANEAEEKCLPNTENLVQKMTDAVAFACYIC